VAALIEVGAEADLFVVDSRGPAEAVASATPLAERASTVCAGPAPARRRGRTLVSRP
jgi:hypothetical protein